MALEWGVTPLSIPETTDVEDLWSRSIDAARDAGIVASRRPRRDHRGHRGEHPRLDERDQGRPRLTGARGRASKSVACRRRGQAAERRRTRARTPRRRLRRRRIPRWVLPLVVLAAVGFLYVRPIDSYLETRSQLDERRAEVAMLRAERARLTHAARAGDERRRPRPPGTADRVCPPRRASLHRRGHRGLGEAALRFLRAPVSLARNGRRKLPCARLRRSPEGTSLKPSVIRCRGARVRSP